MLIGTLRTAIRRTTVLAGLTAAGLGLGLNGPAALAQGSDTLVIARSMDVNSLDPSRSWCDTCQIYLSAVYETLLTMAPDNRTVVANLAGAWQANDDQSAFTFTINPAARFSDGSAVESKDVKWSWLRLRNMKAPPSMFMATVATIATPDAATVEVTLKAPNSEFLGIVAAPYMGVINSDVAIAAGANADANADETDNAETWFLEHSAGSGPYQLVTYRPDDELRLKRNPNYWRAPPAMAEVVLKHTKDAVSQAQMLESGAADIAMQIDPDTAKTIHSADVTVRMVPSFNFVYVALSPGAKGNKVPLTPEVRKAVSYALDYKGLIDLTLGGEGDTQATAIPNGFPGTDALPKPKHDVAMAKKLLAEAGVADGFEIEAAYPNINVYGVDFATMMQKVQQDLSKVNIKVALKPVTFPVWIDQINSVGIPMTAVYYAPDYFGTGQYVNYFAMMKGASWYRRASLSGADKTVENKKAKDLLAKALAAGGADQVKLFTQIGMEMVNDRIIMPIASPKLVLAYRSDIAGVRYSVCCNLPLNEITRK